MRLELFVQFGDQNGEEPGSGARRWVMVPDSAWFFSNHLMLLVFPVRHKKFNEIRASIFDLQNAFEMYKQKNV